MVDEPREPVRGYTDAERAAIDRIALRLLYAEYPEAVAVLLRHGYPLSGSGMREAARRLAAEEPSTAAMIRAVADAVTELAEEYFRRGEGSSMP